MSKCLNHDLVNVLLEEGWIDTANVSVTPLTGGVSSEIYLVEEGEHRFVIKKALEKLKVEADWYADVSRNDTEQAFIQYAGSLLPDSMPTIIGSNAEAGLFAMEFLDGFCNWKEELLKGHFDESLASKAGLLLGEIHAHSWGDKEVQKVFASMPNFDQLRIDPYLRATAARHPHLKKIFLDEAGRLEQSRECLIHGDYSPKNILFDKYRVVPLDCEVACFGDAAFDLSFFLNHFYLKSLYHAPNHKPIQKMIDAAREGYSKGNPMHASEVERRSARLLPMLMLARVDGKSPVEYLDSTQRQFIRQFVSDQLLNGVTGLSELQAAWF